MQDVCEACVRVKFADEKFQLRNDYRIWNQNGFPVSGMFLCPWYYLNFDVFKETKKSIVERSIEAEP